MTRRLGSLALGLAPALLLAACAGGPAAPRSPAASILPSATPVASASPVRSTPGADTTGSVGGNPGVTPNPITGPGGSGIVIPAPSPTDVMPVANLKAVHDVRAGDLKVTTQDGHLMATILWWSGPPPCSALAEVKVAQTGTTFALSVREGALQLGVACPALAMSKRTTVDLGQVAPGTYTVSATGVDATVTIIIDAAS